MSAALLLATIRANQHLISVCAELRKENKFLKRSLEYAPKDPNYICCEECNVHFSDMLISACHGVCDRDWCPECGKDKPRCDDCQGLVCSACLTKLRPSACVDCCLCEFCAEEHGELCDWCDLRYCPKLPHNKYCDLCGSSYCPANAHSCCAQQ